MTSVLCLFVVVGVTVDVVQDDNVGRGEVDAKAARARRQQEDKYVRICVVLINQHNPTGQKHVQTQFKPPKIPLTQVTQ